MSEIRVALDEKDFRTLVAGGVVDKPCSEGHTVKIILSDIGWDRMDQAILAAFTRGLLGG